MIAEAGEKPGSRIAKAFAGIAPPRRRTIGAIAEFQFALSQFSAPSEFSGILADELRRKQAFPASASRVGQAAPGEVKNLVDEDSFEVASVLKYFGVKQNHAPRNGG